MNYKLLIFDFDGTLADTFPWLVSIANEIALKHNFDPISQDQLEEFKQVGTHTLIKKYQVPLWKIPILGRDFQSRMSEDIKKIYLFDGFAGILRNLVDEGFTLALVSSNKDSNVKKVLGTKLSSLFSFYECGVSTFKKHLKFNKILKLSNMAARQALCIGDEIRDIEAARKSNIDFGAVSWGYSDISALKALSPEIIFNSVEDILNKLTNLPATAD